MDRADRLKMLTRVHAQYPEIRVGYNKPARIRVTVQDEFERIVICAVRGEYLLEAVSIPFEQFDRINSQASMNYAYTLALEELEEVIQYGFENSEYDINWNDEVW